MKKNIIYLFYYHVCLYLQFRAAWRRVRGIDVTKAPVNETTVNQISESSSRAYIECSFTSFDKKRKSRHKEKTVQNANLISLSHKKLKNINETLGNSGNNNNKNNSQVFKSPSVNINNELKYIEQRSFLYAKDINRNENNYELRMFSSEANIYGKAINQIIRANSYKSNICWE